MAVPASFPGTTWANTTQQPSEQHSRSTLPSERSRGWIFLSAASCSRAATHSHARGDGEVSKAKDRTPFEAVIDRQNTMAVLKRRLKRAYLDRLVLTLTEAEIFSLLLLFEGHEEPSHS